MAHDPSDRRQTPAPCDCPSCQAARDPEAEKRAVWTSQWLHTLMYDLVRDGRVTNDIKNKAVRKLFDSPLRPDAFPGVPPPPADFVPGLTELVRCMGSMATVTLSPAMGLVQQWSEFKDFQAAKARQNDN